MAMSKAGLSFIHPTVAEALLQAVATDPHGPMAPVFDKTFYPLMVFYARFRAPSLAQRCLRRSSAKGVFIPGVLQCDLDTIAHDTATLALQRARENAAQFDPSKGGAVPWVLRSAMFAYIDVVRRAYGRGNERIVLKDSADPADTACVDPSSVPTAEQRLALDQAMSVLDPFERDVLMRKYRFGHTNAELAEAIYHDATATKKVEHLLSRILRKVKDQAAKASA